jgi:tRNA wybutosine-synthesizing protein 1
MRKRKKSRDSGNYRDILQKQGYQMVGYGGAVKTCLWLRKSLKDEGVCYKEKFYGIKSHCCIQMTPAFDCNQRCLHCWRPVEFSALDECASYDEPRVLVDGSIAAQRRLLTGYKGFEKINPNKLTEAFDPRHVAISLNGEPTLYPFLNELIEEFKKGGLTTFVVSNGTQPDILEAIHPTQLYVSLNAPDEDHYYRICRPISGSFSNFKKSLHVLSEHESRTVVRVTLANGLNRFDPNNYANLIEMAEPDYVEVKSYMHLGFSRKRLPRSTMVEHGDVVAFANHLADALGYVIADESKISRVVLLSKSKASRKIAI